MGWSRGRLQFKKGRMMRTSPCWTCTSHDLPQVTSRNQLGFRVRFGFSRYTCTVSAISPSYDIKTRCSMMRWKRDVDAVLLVLVLAPEGSWIMLCDHDKMLHHLFRPTGPCTVLGLKPKLRAPALLVAPNPSSPIFIINSVDVALKT